MTTPKLGLAPARPGAYKMLLTTYLALDVLPTPPAEFGAEHDVADYGMLGNDDYGDCFWAGSAHETMMWNAEQSRTVDFTDAAVLGDYAKATGFNPDDPSTDQGTDMERGARYRRKEGVHDSSGTAHKVAAYVALPGVQIGGQNDPGWLGPLAKAAYVFGVVGLGIQFPKSAMAQFEAGQVWDVVEGSPIEGGHYVPLVGRMADGNYVVITWGQLQLVTPNFLSAYVEQAIVYLTHEDLSSKGLSVTGLNLAELRRDLKSLTGDNLDGSEDPSTDDEPDLDPPVDPAPDEPTPAPDDPQPTPAPDPEPTPEPTPDPEPTPTPEPDPVSPPAPAPEPEPAPEPNPIDPPAPAPVAPEDEVVEEVDITVTKSGKVDVKVKEHAD